MRFQTFTRRKISDDRTELLPIRTGALQKGWYPLLAIQRHAGPGSLRNRERLEPESG